jgi:tetratricopeptide (TPR) repeat protein
MMWEFLKAALSAVPSAATNGYAFGAYALAVAAYVVIAWRVARNKSLLENLQKLPSKDRLSALEIEIGGVRLAAGISPEQWVRSRINRYYLVAFLATCVVVIAIAALAALRGAKFTTINNEYRQINNVQSLSNSDLQHVKDWIEATMTRDSDRVLAAFKQLPETARVPAVWNELGRTYEGLNSEDDARAAYQNALQKDPDYAPAKISLTRLEDVTPRQKSSPAQSDTRAQSDIQKTVSGQHDVDLLPPTGGGMAELLPSSDWKKITSGNDGDWIWARSGMEAVYSFEGTKQATLGKFAMFIGQADDKNPKDIEISISESVNGPFRVIKQCTFVNALNARTPYQECNLNRELARYLKIKTLTSFSGGESIVISQIRVAGKLAN